MGGGIHCELVPPAGSAEFYFFDEMVPGAAGSLGSGRKVRSGEQREEEKRKKSANANVSLSHRKPPGALSGAQRTEGDDVTWEIKYKINGDRKMPRVGQEDQLSGYRVWPCANGFTGRAQNSPPAFTRQKLLLVRPPPVLG